MKKIIVAILLVGCSAASAAPDNLQRCKATHPRGSGVITAIAEASAAPPTMRCEPLDTTLPVWTLWLLGTDQQHTEQWGLTDKECQSAVWDITRMTPRWYVRAECVRRVP